MALAETILLIPGYNPHDQAGDCVFDEAAAQHALDFFTTCLTHIEGAKAGEPFLLEPWQQAIIGNLFGWKRPDGTRRYRTAFIYVPRKSGKALALDTPIARWAGTEKDLPYFRNFAPWEVIWTTMGDLAPGHFVFDENRKPCKIIEAFPTLYDRECFELDFYYRHSVWTITADAEHLWETTTRIPWGETATRTTKELYDTLNASHCIGEYQLRTIRKVQSVPVRCIRVDSPSNLFLAGRGMIPTHNTPLAAGMCLYALMCDGERGAQIFSAAADKEQAALVYRHARGMAEASKTISKRVKIFKSIGQRAIVLQSDPASAYVVISADAKTKHGGNSHFVVIDELHAQPDRELVDVLDTSLASANRKQPMMVYITTADYDRESICNEKYARACAVRDNGGDKAKPGYDPSFLPVIYETLRKTGKGKDAKETDWTDPKVWAACNPNLGISVSRAYLEQACKEAQEIPGKQNAFKRLHLNMTTSSDVAWLPMDHWDKCAGKVVRKKLLGKECHGGLDMASTTDIAAFVLLFPDDGWKVLPMFWIPEDAVELRVRYDRVPYDEWVKDGFIKTTPGNVVDYDRVREDIVKAHSDFCIRDIACDPWNTTQLQTQLQSEGLEVVKFVQGFANFTAPAKELEKRILSHTVAHSGNPVLRWMAGNVKILEDADGNIRPEKKKARERIDGIVALLMAIGRALQNPDDGTYEGIAH